MAAIVDKLTVGKKHDKRIKLTDEQREEIKELYGSISQRKLASHYGVSRRLIQFIGDPDKHKKNLIRRDERGGSRQYYDVNKHRESMQRHRLHKKILHEKGEI